MVSFFVTVVIFHDANFSIKPLCFTTTEPVGRVILTASSRDLVEFSSVRLSCSVSSGSSVSFLWLNGSSEVTASDRVQLTDGNANLTIVSVTRYDRGPYKCDAFNAVSNGSSDLLLLSISFGPENTLLAKSPSQENYLEGSNITLSCSAVSNPAALFYWLLNGSLLSDTGPEFRLINVQMNQSGNYSCQAFNNQTMINQTSQPSFISVLNYAVTSSTKQPIEGNSVNLTCDAAGSIFTRKWKKNGADLAFTDNMTLHDEGRVLCFQPLNKTDNGTYSCMISNPLSSVEAEYIMIVNYGPENVQITGPSQITLNETLTLTCSADSTPSATYTWKLNETETLSVSAVLKKNITDFSDSGRYICEATNNITRRTVTAAHYLTVTLSSQVPVQNVTLEASGPAIADEPFTLHCEVSGTINRIQWWKDEEIIFPDERIVMDNKTLTIDPVNTSDKGYYQCQAFNAVSNMTSSSYYVKINYGPETPNITGPTAGKTGDNVTLSCYASSHPPSRYTWYFHHYPVAHTPEYVTPPLTKNMSGTYSCEAYNNVTSKNKTANIMLQVVDPIEDVRVEAPMKYPKEGHKYMLECNVTGPADQIYWMKNGLKLHEDNTTAFNIDNNSLTFDPLKRNDTGYYSCKAMNAVGSMVSDPYKLLVHFGPEAVVIVGPKYAETGRSATFNCSAMSVPDSHFSWWYNGTVVASASVFTTDLLTLSMSGEYTCMAYNNVTGKNSTRSTMLTVIEAIESVMIKNYTVPINRESFNLTCDVTGPYDMIYWMKDDLLLNTSYPDESHESANYHIQNNSLLFTPLKIHNNGTYQCDAINKAGGHESPKYMLRVMCEY
uniref:Ig-like domain-containing protein n=1 Tax=Echeneis naucrates TaxID=173247 RepID=A0A665WD00_ECHNA